MACERIPAEFDHLCRQLFQCRIRRYDTAVGVVGGGGRAEIQHPVREQHAAR